ncbi:MAG: thiamine diphosphokinase [Candidatus Marinimicrobia bacterium]|nr:thiamine diphosphokinase [Candidatus Neomarinimicrobiota bacterium]
MSLKTPIVILAAGSFPTHHVPLATIDNAGTLICCDAAADQLLTQDLTPDIVIGDLDSLGSEAKAAFADRLISRPSQSLGDLEKAVEWAVEAGAGEITVVGMTGLRDDHALGNLLLLFHDFGTAIAAQTDTGRFSVVRERRHFDSFPGQPVALFPENRDVAITTQGLAYDITGEALPVLHRGTSNASVGTAFSVEAQGGAVLVYTGYSD